VSCHTCGQPADYHHVRTNRDYCAKHMIQRDHREGRRAALIVLAIAGPVLFALAMMDVDFGCEPGQEPVTGAQRPPAAQSARQGTEPPDKPHSAT
jgi:hypothetical protein